MTGAETGAQNRMDNVIQLYIPPLVGIVQIIIAVYAIRKQSITHKQ
jgi:hypothetical protein